MVEAGETSSAAGNWSGEPMHMPTMAESLLWAMFKAGPADSPAFGLALAGHAWPAI
jgi:hypothetical protein